MSRVYNFSAGPAAIPDPVLGRIKDDIPDWNGTGMSVMEASHRSKAFVAVAEKAEQDLRQLLLIPGEYSVLFPQGGATMQFSMVPLNISAEGDTVDFVQTGSWSKKAIAEARRYCAVNVVADSADQNFTYVPDQDSWLHSEDAAYLHYCANETIAGVEFPFVPESGETPLVCDMSSTMLSRPVDVCRFGVIYAGAQKNIGPAGIAVVIVRKDLIGNAREMTPALLDYATYDAAGSMSNTPPCFAWYVASLVFEYLLAEGGLEVIGKRNQQKAGKLYAAIDASDFYSNRVRVDYRSWMNVPFVLADASLDPTFLSQAEEEGLVNLKGHRSVGGMRASIYNAMPEAGIDALIAFMQEFERTHG
ncbi:MAG: 3-phosphoserine/phosphohydroxythreonine transaminase [Woeseiaceae bacterium]|nr:3-phosphoserine/phosphohydroxythreonine transaminase [Woeseiaceae bacterium]